MPTFYNYRENGLIYSFDDVFVPADLFREGNLFTWGYSFKGILGNAQVGTNVSTPVTTFAGGTNWKQSSVATRNMAAIKTDGTLWTWGYNNFDNKGAVIVIGALGVNDTTTKVIRSTPVTTFAGGTNWKQVSSGFGLGAAIKTDGTLWTWGYNAWGALGDASISNKPTPVTTFAGGTNWKQVSIQDNSFSHAAAIKTDGTLWVWGETGGGKLGNAVVTGNISTPITTFAGGNNWKQVATGNASVTAAIKTDGTLWIWGSGNEGLLGNGLTTGGSISTPVTTFAGGTNWKQVSVGNAHIAAIKTDGTLWTWGNSFFGKLGNATTSAGIISTPITTFAGGTNWKQVSVTIRNTFSIKTDGTLWAWGAGNNGLNGTNDQTNRSTPVTTFAGGTNWKDVAVGCGGESTAALTYDDAVI